jgi:hypothetical protein
MVSHLSFDEDQIAIAELAFEKIRGFPQIVGLVATLRRHTSINGCAGGVVTVLTNEDRETGEFRRHSSDGL